MRKITFLKMMFVAIALVIGSVSVWGQTNPTTGSLPYSFNGASSIPTSMAIHRFGTTTGTIPTTRTTSDGNGDLPSTTGNNSGGYMIEGTGGADGISLLASGSQAAGAIVVEISTLSKTAINVSWVSWTKLDQASYTMSMALQYRVGESGSWINVDSPSTVYSTNSTFGRSNSTSFTQTLPVEAENKSIVQVRWIYWASSGTSGSRDRLAIDEISILGTTTSSCTPSTLTFATPIVDKTMANVSYTQTATSLNATTPITYSSSNTAVAFTVGGGALVTIAGAGSTVITATQAAGTHNSVDYCASTASYTLNVASIAPTITVTEVTVPNMTSYVGDTKTETVNVSGINLTGDLTVSIVDDVDNQFDEPSVTSIAKLGDNTASGTVTVTYRPTASGTHTATLKIESSDATTVTRALNGTATWTPLATPVATTANPISNSGFTANWDAVAGATEYQLDVYTKTSNPLADLIISEYGEGSSNNKYVEIYNGTGASVDLSNYTLKQSLDGSGWDIDVTYTLPLTGTLANNDVYVISTSNANQTILDQADKIIVYSNSLQGGRVVSFTGNDAIGLFKNGVLIDLFGDPAVTSTISVAGAAMGDNHTMVRKSNIATGNTNWTTSAGTDATSSEWTINATDTWTFIGSHNYLGVTKTPVSGSPFTVTGETSKALSGLSAETTYYYTVVAKNTNVASAVSNEIAVATSPTTDINQLGKELNLHVSDNRIEFISSANETVAVYNAVGQKLVQKLTVNGLNSIPISAHGVVLVKVGNRFAKVIL